MGERASRARSLLMFDRTLASPVVENEPRLVVPERADEAAVVMEVAKCANDIVRIITRKKHFRQSKKIRCSRMRSGALVLVVGLAACLCLSLCAAVAYLYFKDTPANGAGKTDVSAVGAPSASMPIGVGVAAVASAKGRPAVTNSCIFSANFVIPNASGKSTKSGPAMTNPLKQGADPAIVNVGGTYYMSSTMSPFEKSNDLRQWSSAGTMSAGRQFWAPEFACVGGVWWCLFCDGLNAGCHALRSAGGVGGPYNYSHAIPVQPAMDPSIFIDFDGKCYILTSSVGAAGGLWIHEISPDMKTVGKGAVVAKVNQQPSWMREPVAEGGQVLCRVVGGRRKYYAVFSGNGCCHAAGANFYALGYATADNPMGPWTLSGSNPILGDGKSGVGYGHHCFYHANSGALGVLYQRETGPRELCVSKAWFDDAGRLIIEPPLIGTSKPSP